MGPTINLTFRYTEAEYVRAMRFHYAARLRVKLDIVLAIIVAAAGFYFLRSTDWEWVGMPCIVLAGVLLLMIFTAMFIIPRRVFRSTPKLHDEYTLSFSPDGIHFRTAHINSNLQWSLYSRVLVDAHSYLLYYGKNSFSVIPKRVFSDVEQQAFERLLTDHVPEIVRFAE